MDDWLPDKSKFKDSIGKYITQSLFLENGYDEDKAVYTLKDQDWEYKGRTYKSLRLLYLQEMDVTEYEFANKYLWGWDHWQRIVNNQLMTETIAGWRDELEVKLRAQGIRAILLNSIDSFAAAKWIADGKWEVKRGRPSKAELARERKIRENAVKEAESDSDRIVHLLRKQSNED